MTPGGYNNNFCVAGSWIRGDSQRDGPQHSHHPHGPTAGDIRQWAGDSRGHWEGDTLVVDTTNFYAQTSLNGSSPTLHVVERFRRVDATHFYEFTVDDPATWTLTAQVPA
jgi:hypothetical protein